MFEICLKIRIILKQISKTNKNNFEKNSMKFIKVCKTL